MIMSQTKIFNFFPGSVQAGSIYRILSSFANRYKNTYIPQRNIWINRLYFDISNSRQKQCFTAVDTRDVNDLVPAKCRTAEQNKFVIIIGIRQTSFNSFLAARQQTSQAWEINVFIVEVIDNINRNDAIYSEVCDELSNLKNDKIQSTIQQTSESNTLRTSTSTGQDRRRQKYTGFGRASKKSRFFSG